MIKCVLRVGTLKIKLQGQADRETERTEMIFVFFKSIKYVYSTTILQFGLYYRSDAGSSTWESKFLTRERLAVTILLQKGFKLIFP